ncbi:uncharacterized protein K452DRAFT_163397 [Aplosporella prunicola CBS 121167]|uniref:DUF2293 domain-containing protein n=1 Tax=Aplosporella prunicola CBS 121167 TaxID=1176127 RepID=A0A6A6BKL9_9PEZI|nr:uncharacterized protein K452DRAFT_163397 [Aplosporella prunicola CBS 121167]KAF2143855.1 hypothetical protein K452DRAFT_163397 [Aplosporella prunicola CBS 121167]
MVRVQSRAASVHASRAQSKAASRRNKKPYKVVFESVTQEKKKLRSAVSFNDRAPPGYTFIPVGSPELTERCKELCRRRGLEVHIVSAKPTNKAAVDPNKLGYHVHRLGYHFPNVVVDEAVEWLDIDIAPSRKSNTDGYTSKIAQGLESAGRKLGMAQNASAEQTEQQISITMKDLFPKIPEKALKAIVKHAFRKGSDRVGSSDLPLARKVQLAVLAHVRHKYTDYDKMLKERSWHEARATVEGKCLDKLLEWRGENDDGKIEMEDEFREVIILDDDEEDGYETTSGSDHDSREASVEIISSQATARELEAPEPPESDWMRTHYRAYGHRLGIPQILRPRQPTRKRAASPLYPQPPPYVTDSGHTVAHTRPLTEESRYARPLGPPPDARLLAAGGRIHYDVSWMQAAES